MRNFNMTIGGVEFDLRLTFLVIFSAVVPMLDYYNHRITAAKAYDRVILYFIVPMLVIIWLFRESPSSYGLQWGNWRAGLAWTIAACIGMAIILWFVARTPAMQQYYDARAPKEIARLVYFTGVDLFGWEFVWRGFLLFGMARIIGPGPAILFQAIPFAFMHLGKPEVETMSTIFGGIGFGFVAWQSQSFLYPWLIHWFIATFTKLIAIGRF
jgi:membrane protease YdiL (CAAX protease family)